MNKCDLPPRERDVKKLDVENYDHHSRYDKLHNDDYSCNENGHLYIYLGLQEDGLELYQCKVCGELFVE